VGLFAVVTVVAGYYIYQFVNKGAGSGSGYVVYAIMDDASGIAKHSQVRVAGIPVGNIQSVKLDGNRARIDIRINDDVPLYDDAGVKKVASSLLGEYFLSIVPGTEGKRELEDGDRIKNVLGATSMDDLMGEVAAIAKDVRRVSAALADSVGSDRGQQNIKDTLQNLADVTDALNKTVRENRGSIRQIIQNVEGITNRGAPEIDRILENVRETTREVRELVALNEQNPQQSGEVRQIIQKVNRASDSLENALANINTATERIERGEGTLGRLSKDEHLINEVEGIAEGVGSFVGGLNRVQTIVALRNDFQFLAGTVKSFVEIQIQPREDKYYSIEVVNDPRGATSIEQIDVESNRSGEFAHYREIRTVTKNALRFSVQFAQRFGPFVGRFGLKESTGGVGLDVLLFDDRFELKQDLYGFGEVVLPRWRIHLGYEFVNRLWLLAGVDDIFSGTRRDYFVGLQLKFNDRDLKTILPFAPTP
jgi:phospholipid/cholesterol/gamma-HCH transport system substrate-binding protein